MKICVCKVGRSPKIYADISQCDHQARSSGDWELVQLIKLLSDHHPEAEIIVIGRCRPQKGVEFDFVKNKNVTFYPYKGVKGLTADECIAEYVKHGPNDVDEFHYIMGPHTRHNGAFPMWDHKKDRHKRTLCMFYGYVAPIVATMNANPQARHFPYLSDRRYFWQARDLHYVPKFTLTQCIVPFKLQTPYYRKEDLEYVKDTETEVAEKTDAQLMVPVDSSKVTFADHTAFPFRFEAATLLYGRDPNEFKSKLKGWKERPYMLSVISNQIAPSLDGSRFQQIKENVLDHFSPDEAKIIGKWKDPGITEEYLDYFHLGSIDGLGTNFYEEACKFKYSAIFFNWKDCGKKGGNNIRDNWVTVKVYETMLMGCVTLIECCDPEKRAVLAKFIDDSLIFSSGEELRMKVMETNPADLIRAQIKSLRSDFYDGSYFMNFIEKLRKTVYRKEEG